MVSGTHNARQDPRNEAIQIFINGEFFPRREAKISVFDSGYLVGDGIWEAFRLHRGVLLFLDKHLDRLWQSAKTTSMPLPFTRAELEEHIWNTIRKNDMQTDVHIRLMITRGIKETPSQDPRLTITPPNLVIIPEYKVVEELPKDRGINLFTSTIRRGSPDSLDPRLNCHSKRHEVLALLQAIEAGADEALMLDVQGFVSTCNSTNFFIVKEGTVLTSTGEYCLHGITRAVIINLCEENGIPCYQKNFSLFDVYDAEEAFVTGSFGGITPVRSIDNHLIGENSPKSLTQMLSQLYLERIHQLTS